MEPSISTAEELSISPPAPPQTPLPAGPPLAVTSCQLALLPAAKHGRQRAPGCQTWPCTAPCPALGQMNEGGTEASSAPAPLPALRLHVPQRLGQPRPYSHAICSLPQPKQAARERRDKPASPGAWPRIAATF